MYLKEPLELLEKMNIQTPAVIIDQCDENAEEHICFKGNNIDIYHVTERGLSKSRNLAIKKAEADILVFADDDGDIGAILHLSAKDAVVFRFLVAQLHHAGGDDDTSPRELLKHFQRSLRTHRVGVERVIDDGEATGVFHQFQTVFHRLELFDAVDYLLQVSFRSLATAAASRMFCTLWSPNRRVWH